MLRHTVPSARRSRLRVEPLETPGRATGVHVRMENHGGKLALWRLVGILFAELHGQLEAAALPYCLGFARDHAFPEQEILRAVSVGPRFRDKTMRMILPPSLPLLLQTPPGYSCHVYC